MYGCCLLFSFSYLCPMFIREVKKKNAKDGKIFFQYQLAQASRIEGKVKQYQILYLGSEPLLGDTAKRKMLLDLLQAKIFSQSLLFADGYPLELRNLADTYYQKFLIKYKGVALDTALSIPPRMDAIGGLNP